MSRPRNPKNAWMPPNVYLKKGRYVIKTSSEPYKEQLLAPGSATQGQVWQLYERFMQQDTNTLYALRDAYVASEKFSTLAPASQKSYTFLLGQLLDWEMPHKKRPFGTLLLDQVGNVTIQSAYDQQSPGAARNRRFAVLKAVFSWAIQRYPQIQKNPVYGLESAPEPPRKRYVKDEEFQFIYDLAPRYMQLMMEGAYLLRLRRGEVSRLERLRHILPHGVLVERSKGSWDGVVEWSPRLERWVKDCKRHNPNVVSKWLIHGANGSRVTDSAHNNAWQRLWKKARETEGCPEYFRFHDIKAKGITDHPEKEGGHKSPKMKEVYDRENRVEKPTK